MPLRRRLARWLDSPVMLHQELMTLMWAGSRGYRMEPKFPGILTDDELRAIDVPVRLISGARSAMLTPAEARARGSLMPHAEVAIVPGSHGGFNRIDELNGRIAAFIEAQAADKQAAQPAQPPTTRTLGRHLHRTPDPPLPPPYEFSSRLNLVGCSQNRSSRPAGGDAEQGEARRGAAFVRRSTTWRPRWPSSGPSAKTCACAAGPTVHHLRFDGVDLATTKVGTAALADALATLDPAVRAALEEAIRRTRLVHEARPAGRSHDRRGARRHRHRALCPVSRPGSTCPAGWSPTRPRWS